MSKKKDETGGLSAIGEGLKEVFGGLFKPAETGGITPIGEKPHFILRYLNDEVPVFEDMVEGDMPTVKEAFAEHASSISLDPTRECQYRDGGVRCDENKVTEFGSAASPQVYVASVKRTVKG